MSSSLIQGADESSNSLTVEAHGKINWTLDVFAKRPDGYHEIASIVQRIALADRLTFARSSPGIRLSIVGPEAAGVPNDDRNIVWKAAQLLGVDGIDIEIEKNIPNQAGLGGGSSDGAAALKGLNALFDRRHSEADLAKLAANLGADVTFFLTEQVARIEGFGERVTKIDDGKYEEIAILKPDVGVSTVEAYNALDRIQPRVSRNATASWPAVLPSNDFEDAVFALSPEVLEAVEALKDAGATETLLCGSGAAVMTWGSRVNDIVNRLLESGYTKVWQTRTI